MLEIITNPANWVALLTLTALEIVLGIDNIIFISILSGKLPEDQRNRARTTGLGLAMGTRILLLLSLSWIIGLTEPLFHIGPYEVTGQMLILMGGGLFLMGKSTYEIHEKLEGEEGHVSKQVQATFASVLIQILLLDIVFSLDSVITAVGMADEIAVMIAAVVIAVGVMMVAARPISEFVEARPTVKMLALSFLLLIGFSLAVEGLPESLHVEIPKGYIYFAMGFAVFVEMLNLQIRKASPVKLHNRVSAEEPGEVAADAAPAAE